ncbi:CRISPR-associated endonuclease Cas3'' [Pseudorhodoferax sp. Leaf274]|uniref:CRISPR-associated endonuclease Cas3'' n=1 Tax=Pseudorhodoferax sp. Leaf274 TaxID=1736318 RepID=UPI0009EC6FA3|nr:CRISPR-associated endonuclease Cas3'' [Pseudorhodoferax sp. Leaf274]
MKPKTALAHIRLEADGQRVVEHWLVDHSLDVASLARDFAATFGPQWAAIAGRWHDLGKFRPGFYRYIRGVSGADAHLEGKWPTGNEKTHSAAGALHALDLFEQRYGPAGRVVARVLAYVIAGHHAGLDDWTAGLDTRLLGTRAPDSRLEYDQARAKCLEEAPELLDLPAGFDLRTAAADIPGARSSNPLALALWVRMLFSALVDADFLDTERFMDEGRNDRRSGFATITSYREQLDQHLARKADQVAAEGREADPVMQARQTVLAQCRTKAALPPGVFSLTVPTGGGKTLSSLAFALAHAEQHGKRRVVYAIPYTSIIEQTADVLKGIFGPDAVIEHHSQADTDHAAETPRSRLACENWDAPLIVTTNVQLFESLFAARTSRCRKLHRLAGSVIVLDEAQLLPPRFLQPILDALHVLVAHYGVTLLLCTATQPVLTDGARFDPRENLRGLPSPTPIIDDESALFAALERVTIEWPADLQTPLSTDALVERLAAEPCVLTIVNTRKDAAEIVAALDAATGDRALHLSAAMCGQHRADVIRDIRQRLAARRAGTDLRPLRVVSTQLVEAGVDIDFPVVFRALAGLDSIAQAAGRCNREGLLPGGAKGRVVVFVRAVPKLLTELRNGVQASISIRATGMGEALGPAAFQRYFPQFYDAFRSRDERGIVELLKKTNDFNFSFGTAATKFKLIDDEDQAQVIVPYTSLAEGAVDPAPLIAKLRAGDTDRWLMRALQRYTVTARKAQVTAWQTAGDVQEVQPGCFLLIDALRYDERFGLRPDNGPLDPGSFFI